MISTIFAWVAGSRAGRTVAAILGAVALFVGALIAARESGRKNANLGAKKKDAERANEIRKEIIKQKAQTDENSNLDDAALDRELHKLRKQQSDR